jgi:hypothetical protein
MFELRNMHKFFGAVQNLNRFDLVTAIDNEKNYI